MNETPPAKDLIILVADKNFEAAFRGLLSRHESLGVHSITFDIFVHPNRDPGCYRESERFLQSFSGKYSYAMVVFDRIGCGTGHSRDEIESDVETKLARNGWENRSKVIVLDPELEVWVWTQSPHVDEALGWKKPGQSLRDWLVEYGLADSIGEKPKQPKEAMEKALRQAKKPRSSAIYLRLAQSVSLEGHQEPAFLKLVNTLREWFEER
jgi:hypothetical protein